MNCTNIRRVNYICHAFVFVAQVGVEPTRPQGPEDFLTTSAFTQTIYLRCCSLDYFLTMLFSLGFTCIVSTPFTHFCDLVSHHQLWCHHQIGFRLLGWFYFWSFPQSTRIDKTGAIDHSATSPIVWSYFQRTYISVPFDPMSITVTLRCDHIGWHFWRDHQDSNLDKEINSLP